MERTQDLKKLLGYFEKEVHKVEHELKRLEKHSSSSRQNRGSVQGDCFRIRENQNSDLAPRKIELNAARLSHEHTLSSFMKQKEKRSCSPKSQHKPQAKNNKKTFIGDIKNMSIKQINELELQLREQKKLIELSNMFHKDCSSHNSFNQSFASGTQNQNKSRQKDAKHCRANSSFSLASKDTYFTSPSIQKRQIQRLETNKEFSRVPGWAMQVPDLRISVSFSNSIKSDIDKSNNLGIIRQLNPDNMNLPSPPSVRNIGSLRDSEPRMKPTEDLKYESPHNSTNLNPSIQSVKHNLNDNFVGIYSFNPHKNIETQYDAKLLDTIDVLKVSKSKQKHSYQQRDSKHCDAIIDEDSLILIELLAE